MVTLTTSTMEDFDGMKYYSNNTTNEILEDDLINTTISKISSNSSTIFSETSAEEQEIEPSLNVIYTVSECFVSILAICGNILVIWCFIKNRSLRRYRNYYIIGLACADFLVGLLGIPLAILASIGLPKNNLYGCLFSVSILMVLCTISILCLVAVSIDRYWATNNPFAYYRNMTASTSIGIILSCWIVGAIIGFLPLFGWYNEEGWISTTQCYFTKVMDYNYIVFIYFSTIIFPALLMACFYGYIYHIVLIKIRQKSTLLPNGRRQSEASASRSGSLNSDLRDSTQMMRVIVSEKRREGKAAKKLSIIVLFFMICWMPLYTINCIEAFCSSCKVPSQLLNFTIILSHANSAINPFLYAYHLKEFRLAMRSGLYSLCSWISCGRIKDNLQKDASVSVSRSLTMPTISANHSLANPSNKFRKVAYSSSQTEDSLDKYNSLKKSTNSNGQEQDSKRSLISNNFPEINSFSSSSNNQKSNKKNSIIFQIEEFDDVISSSSSSSNDPKNHQTIHVPKPYMENSSEGEEELRA